MSGGTLILSFLNASIFSFSNFFVATIFSTAVTFCCNFPAKMSAYLTETMKPNFRNAMHPLNRELVFFLTFPNVSIDANAAAIRCSLWRARSAHRSVLLICSQQCDRQCHQSLKTNWNSPTNSIRINAFWGTLPTENWKKKLNHLIGKGASADYLE